MRYEFERDGTVVASVLWEGPGQVTVEAAEPTVRSTVDRYLSSEVIYLAAASTSATRTRDDVLQMRRRDWTPWEFERACRNLSQRLSATVKRVETGPVEAGRWPPDEGHRRPGAVQVPRGRGRRHHLRHPRRRDPARLRPADRLAAIRHILCRHEQGAGHAAEGYARATGKVGRRAWRPPVPGATQPRDRRSPTRRWTRSRSSPSPARCRRRSIGNDAFQEADITGITMPVTKHNWLVMEPGRHRRGDPRGVPHRARPGGPARCSSTSRRTCSVAETDVEVAGPVDLPGYKPTTKGNRAQVVEAAKLIMKAKRPVLYVGGGVIKADAAEELLSWPTDGQCRSSRR